MLNQQQKKIPVQCECSYFLSSHQKDLISTDCTYKLWWRCPFCKIYNCLVSPKNAQLILIDEQYSRKIEDNIKYVLLIEENLIINQSLLYLLSAYQVMEQKSSLMLQSLCQQSPILMKYNNYKASLLRKKSRQSFNYQLFYNRRMVTKLQYIIWLINKCFEQVSADLYIAFIDQLQQLQQSFIENCNYFRFESLIDQIITSQQKKQSSTEGHLRGPQIGQDFTYIFTISQKKMKHQQNKKIKFLSLYFLQQQPSTISDNKVQSINIGNSKQYKQYLNIKEKIYNHDIQIFSESKVTLPMKQIFTHIDNLDYGISARWKFTILNSKGKIRIKYYSKRKKEWIEWLYNSEQPLHQEMEDLVYQYF